MRTSLRFYGEAVDLSIEHVRRLIDIGSRRDHELAAGLATTEPMPSIQSKLDDAIALACEVDKLVRSEDSGTASGKKPTWTGEGPAGVVTDARWL